MFGRNIQNAYVAQSGHKHHHHHQPGHKKSIIKTKKITVVQKVNSEVSSTSNSTTNRKEKTAEGSQQQGDNSRQKVNKRIEGKENGTKYFCIPRLSEKKVCCKGQLKKTNLKKKDSVSTQPPSKDSYEFFLYNMFPGASERREMLELQLTALINQCRKEWETLHKNTYRALSAGVVDAIVYHSAELGVNIATIYRAIELFDRFVIRFNDEIYIQTQAIPRKTDLDLIAERIDSQGYLRMCTCLLIASKLHSDTRTPIITPEKIKDLLQKEGYSYKKEAVTKSEIRVMMSLNFKFHWVTPFELVELMVSLVDVEKDQLPEVYRLSMVVLEFCYQTHADLYKRLFYMKHPKPHKVKITEKTFKEFKSKVEFDVPLRATAVVACALWMVHHRSFCKELATLTLISEKDIDEFAALLLHLTIL